MSTSEKKAADKDKAKSSRKSKARSKPGERARAKAKAGGTASDAASSSSSAHAIGTARKHRKHRRRATPSGDADESKARDESQAQAESTAEAAVGDAVLDAVHTSSPAQFVELRAKIGEGAYGKIYHGVQQAPRRQCAVKQLPYAVDGEAFADVMREIATMRRLADAPNVVQFYGAYVVSDFDKQSLWIVMEFAACGSLSAYMKARKQPLSESGIRHALRCAARGLHAVHSRKIIHRDLKSDNLLWCTDGRILLADLGEAAWLDEKGFADGTKGTPYFMSPECALGSQYSAPTDIWSFGIMAIELAEQRPPKHEMHPLRVLFSLATNEDGLPALAAPEKHSKEFVALVSRTIVADAAKRPTASELLQDEFLVPRGASLDNVLLTDDESELHTDCVRRANELLGKTLTSSSSTNSFTIDTLGSDAGDASGTANSAGGTLTGKSSESGAAKSSAQTSLLGMGQLDDDELAALRDATQVRDPETGETCDEFTTDLLKWKSEEANADALQKLTSKLRHTPAKHAAALFANNDTTDMAAFRRKFDLMTCVLTLASKVSSKAFGFLTTDRWLGNTFYEKCFTGKDAVDWIYENMRMPLRDEAVQLVLHLESNGMILPLTPPTPDNVLAIDDELHLFRFNNDKIKQWSRVYQYEPPALDDAEQAAEILHFQKKKDLNKRDWRLLLAGAQAVNFEKDSKLFDEGDTNSALFRVKQGTVRVEKLLPGDDGEKKPTVVARLGPETMFGEMSVMSRDAKTSAAIVSDSADCKVDVIDVDFIYDLFTTEPGLKQRFYYNICLKLVGMIKSKNSAARKAEKGDAAAPAAVVRPALTKTASTAAQVAQMARQVSPRARAEAADAVNGEVDRDAEYRRTFGLAESEVVIDQYDAVVKNFAIKLYGTVFVSTNFFCFRAKVFGKTTKYAIPFSDIALVSRSSPTTLVVSRRKGKPLKFSELQRAQAAADLCLKLVERAATPEGDLRAAMSSRRFRSRRRRASEQVPSTPKTVTELKAQSSKSVRESTSMSSSSSVAAAATAAAAAAASSGGASDLRRHTLADEDEIENAPIDTTLTAEDWDLLLAGAKSETVAKDTVIIAEDEWATRIYQIGKGACRVEIGGKRVGKMSSGEVFGEISFLEGARTTASVIAETDDTEVLIIEGGVLKVLFVRQPALAGRFFCYLAGMLSARLKAREV